MGLDLFLWLGPRLRAPNLWRLFSFEIPAGLDANTRLFAQDLQTGIRQALDGANWFSWLRPALLGVPGIEAGTAQMPLGSQPAQVYLWDVGAFSVAALALLTLGIGLGGLYWTLIARQARDGRIDWSAALGRLATVWPRMLGLALLMIGVVILAWVLVMLISMLLGPAVGALAVILAVSLLVWLMFYATFSLHGIVLYNQRTLDAVRMSMWLGRTYFGKTAAFLAASVVVGWGMSQIWNVASSDSWLRLIAIGGNAFVAAGLSMASMVYYQDHVPMPVSTLKAD